MPKATASAPVAEASDDLERSVLARAPALLWSARPDGSRDWLSPAWAERTGRGIDALGGSGWLASVHDEDVERWRGIFQASVEARRPYELDLRLRAADGSWRWMLEQGAPRLTDDRVVGYVGVLVDIDARKQSEERLAERARSLRIADRRQARFLGLLSHALRNPLAPIGNAASVLRTLEAGQPTLVRLREILERQVTRMGRLIDELVDATRAAQGRISVVSETVEVTAFVRAAIEAAGPVLADGRHGVDLRLPDARLVVRGDPMRLTQALAQLIGNAARFTREPGTIEVEIVAAAGRVRIAVRDRGQGIGAEFLPHVFELFAQEERRDGHRSAGLGIGLTLARRIAQLHGGDVVAESEGWGRGACFTLELPVAASDVQPHRPSALDERFRVLVVDRDAGAGEALRREMEMWGNEVRWVADAAEALALGPDYAPQLVLCNVDSGTEPDLERFHPLRQRYPATCTLLAAVGDAGGDGDEARALAHGYDSFLVKPLQADLLARLLRACATMQA